jgi:hypothetical protein
MRGKPAWREYRAAKRTLKAEVAPQQTERKIHQTAGQARRGLVGVVVDKIAQRKWLVPLFAAGAVVFFGLGYSLHRSAEPPDVAAVQRGSQVVDLSIFTSNPQADVSVNVFVDASTYATIR